MYKQESDERYKLLEIPVSNRPPELCHTSKLHSTDTKIAHCTTYSMILFLVSIAASGSDPVFL